jgi:uncharacterized membrane protein YeiH
MDDGLSFFCGSVPIIILLWHHGWGGPIRQLGVLLAGCIGGLVAYMAFGPQFAAGGGVVPLFLISVAGGSFLGIVADTFLGRTPVVTETRAG